MEATPIYDGGEYEVTRLRLELDAEEARTIWYALTAYREKLEASIRNAARLDFGRRLEEEAFLFPTIGMVSRVLYGIREDHPPEEHDDVVKWLNAD